MVNMCNFGGPSCLLLDLKARLKLYMLRVAALDISANTTKASETLRIASYVPLPLPESHGCPPLFFFQASPRELVQVQWGPDGEEERRESGHL